MSVYRVEKSEQPVVLFLTDGSVMKGVAFLSARTYSHLGQQTVADLLQEKSGFFPFRAEAGTFCAVNKAAVSHLRYEADHSERERELAGHPNEVLITFAGGEQLRGQVAIAMPAGHNRLLDFINAASGFFPIHTGEAHYLVNTGLIRDISPC